MASDLEKFLQQAAERLAQKVQEAQGPRSQGAPHRSPSQSVRRAERAGPRLDPEIVDAELVEAAEMASPSRREQGPNPLSRLDTRPGLAHEISQSDEKLSGHLHDTFDHDVVQLRQASAALTRGRGETEKSTNLERREMSVSPLVDMLRRPETLRAAFIASEIFKRKF